MGRSEEYRRNAEEAERRARETRFEVERLGFEKIAQGWRELLAVEEARQKPGRR